MLIETNDVVYKTFFSHSQIEITGACNMNCTHCRASDERPIFMDIDIIKFIFAFANANKGKSFNLTISGGEPLLHPKFFEIMELSQNYSFEEIVVTTNGSLITDTLLSELNQLNIPKLTIQISLDSVNSQEHDAKRNFLGAYEQAIASLQLLQRYPHLISSVRMTVTRESINQMGAMAELLSSLGVSRFGVGSVIPFGKGVLGNKVLTPQEKQMFLVQLAELQRKWRGTLEIVTEDPLKCLIPENPWISDQQYSLASHPAVFGGCTAGIDCFNVNTYYQITPCSMFPEVIVADIRDFSTITELTKAYESSTLIQKLFERNFEGNCGRCTYRRICGGCRAVAFYCENSYFASDRTCWSSLRWIN